MTGPSPWGPRWSRYLGRFFARIVWRTTIVGAAHVPASGAVILAANHTGFIDGPVLAGVSPRPLHILVKQEMFHGVFGFILRTGGQIRVAREDGGVTALRSARAVLRRGGAVGIFPEGNRGDGDVADARGGVAWLALSTGATVVPVAILGTRRDGESIDVVPRFGRRLHVTIGEPIQIFRAAGTTGRQAQAAAAERIRVALAEQVARAVAASGYALPRQTEPDM